MVQSASLWTQFIYLTDIFRCQARENITIPHLNNHKAILDHVKGASLPHMDYRKFYLLLPHPGCLENNQGNKRDIIIMEVNRWVTEQDGIRNKSFNLFIGCMGLFVFVQYIMGLSIQLVEIRKGDDW